MLKLRTLVLLFAAVVPAAHAQWKVVSVQSEPGRAGAEHRHLVFENAANGQRADVDVAIFSSKSCTLRVMDNPEGERLASVVKRDGYVCGVNGGYFDENFKPIGLRVVNGESVAPLQRARLITGVLLASSRGVQIVRARDFSQRQKLGAAIQCGPFLVDSSQPVRGLNDSAPARRTFAATGRSDRALVGVSSEVSLANLAKILAAADLNMQRAMNLDGGSSTAFWFARENGSAFSIPEYKSVRDFVAVVPK
ncbi:MAG TPA: phosphodiester glycosidase family protein [Candidatus Udaeobacter sp.]|nr:phosphodiester glycosidase family protein [Candidatus Udaeobacter sp.]